MFEYVTRRSLWINILVGIAILLILFVLLIFSLNWVTKHGDASTVPAIVGKNLADGQKILDQKGFAMVIQDSVFFDSLPPGVVVKQVPEPDDVVKVNRTVYVTINRYVAPDVQMPNLLGFSFRNAEMVLHNLGLKVGDTTYKSDFAKNSVLDQLLDGNTIKPGDKVKVGSSISLVLGSGVGTEEILVPDLVGRSFEEAKALLDAQGLILGSVVPDPDVRDTLSAFVKEQRPQPRNEAGRQLRIRPGQMVDVFLSAQKPVADSTLRLTPTPPAPPQTQQQ